MKNNIEKTALTRWGIAHCLLSKAVIMMSACKQDQHTLTIISQSK